MSTVLYCGAPFAPLGLVGPGVELTRQPTSLHEQAMVGLLHQSCQSGSRRQQQWLLPHKALLPLWVRAWPCWGAEEVRTSIELSKPRCV